MTVAHGAFVVGRKANRLYKALSAKLPANNAARPFELYFGDGFYQRCVVQWERFKKLRLVKVRLLLPGKVGTVEATHALSSQDSKSITGNGSGIALPA